MNNDNEKIRVIYTNVGFNLDRRGFNLMLFELGSKYKVV